MDRWSLVAAAVLTCSCSDNALSLATIGRRRLLAPAVGVLLSPLLFTDMNATAACMSGDLSPGCIGVYKLPENALSAEDMKRFAPDMKYVTPLSMPTSIDAMEMLKTQRIAADDIMLVVKAGKLEEAGIKTLNIIPKIVLAGRRILDDTKGRMVEAEGDVRALRELQLNESFQVLEASWKNADVTIGQGLRGDLGVSAVAQIRILSDLRDATVALDDFLAMTNKH